MERRRPRTTIHAVNIDEDFQQVCEYLAEDLLAGDRVDTGHWQALRDVPQTKTLELTNVLIEIPIAPTSGSWASMIRPNLPWAEAHFRERVGGEPLNPGEEYKNWPWYKGNVEEHKPRGAFSHTYMERFWPRRAGYRDPEGTNYDNHGIRYRYGDLNDVLDLLTREPYTRQAFLPVWFPEDTGAHHGERVPCTLGYHFLLRDDKLHCTYFIRSCDFIRYFRDDIYMAGRLVQWVIRKLLEREDIEQDDSFGLWHNVEPGILTFHAVSLHIFEGPDEATLRRQYDI